MLENMNFRYWAKAKHIKKYPGTLFSKFRQESPVRENLNAGFDVAGAGNVLKLFWWRASSRPYLKILISLKNFFIIINHLNFQSINIHLIFFTIKKFLYILKRINKMNLGEIINFKFYYR